ncbi:O-antigen ligase family protein [Streptococcus uberis]|uniref:O-antigen ligase family protein n=2 Tax=Streptococcus uberis TaxID=1349 RepID=UPI003D6BCEBF
MRKSTDSVLTNKLMWLFVPLIYIFCGYMLEINPTVNFPYGSIIALLYSAFGIVTFAFFLLKHVFSKRNILLVLLLLLFEIFAISIPAGLKIVSFSSSIIQSFSAVMWISAFFMSYWIGVYHLDAVKHTKALAFVVVLFAILFIGVRQYSTLYGGVALISSAYYTLFLLPYVLLLDKKLIKWSLVFVIFATVLLSVKRTGFIAFALAAVTYLIVDYRHSANKNGERLRKTVGIIILIIAITVFFQIYTSNNNLDILTRLSSISDDGGSGRTEVWSQTIEMIKESPFYLKLFGHGFNMVYHDSPMKLSAHNDILECIYDYGFVGLFLYAVFVKKIIGYYIVISKEKSELAAPFAVSIVLFVIMSLVSHVLIYPTYFLFIVIFWGLIIGEYDSSHCMLGGKKYV